MVAVSDSEDDLLPEKYISGSNQIHGEKGGCCGTYSYSFGVNIAVIRTETSKFKRIAMIDGYHIRRYQPEDLNEFLRAYRETFTGQVTPEWFQWKYVDNPYTEEIPVYVAVKDGTLVGGAAFWPLRMSVGDGESVQAIQPCDAFVLDEHRRRGIYAQLLSKGLDYYAETDASFCFDFPIEPTKRAFEKHGWRMVQRLSMYYRVQGTDSILRSPFNRVANVVVRKYLQLRDGPAASPESGFRVNKSEGVASRQLARIRHSNPLDGFQAIRDEEFYDWRFNNPIWDFKTYILRQADSPEAGAIVASHNDNRTARIVDVVPFGMDNRPSIYTSLLDSIINDESDRDILSVTPGAIPQNVLFEFGFLRDDRFPFALFSELTNFGVYPLSGDPGVEDSWVINGRRLTDPSNWAITYSEMDNQ